MATAKRDSFTPGCGSIAKWWSATGRMREVQDRIAAWMRVVRAWADWQGAKFARFDDNMREVAVTEGDKVSAEAKFGYSVNALRHR